MILAVCLDDKLGLAFNNRRQSRDKILIKDLLSYNKKIYALDISSDLFSPTDDVCFAEKLPKLKKDDIAFIEGSIENVNPDDVDGLILYRWNTIYPADKYFSLNLTDFKLTAKTDFVGNSHPKITKEIYAK
ncbi:MAG: ribonuclease Z [Christensenellaceae bacterium]